MFSNRYSDEVEQFANERLQQRKKTNNNNTMVTTKTKPGINLYDVLPLCPIKKSNNKEKSEIINQILGEKNDFISLNDHLGKYFNNDVHNSVLNDANLNKEVIKKIDDSRRKFLDKFGYLPTQIQNSIEINKPYYNHPFIVEKSDWLTDLSKTPKIKGSDVKEIVDKFNFIAIPFECLNEKSFENETYSMRQSIRNFNNKLKGDYDVYVITPIEYYSLEKHVKKNTEEKSIYAGQHSMVFTSIIINVPMFRTILNSMADNTEDINSLRNENKQINKSLEQINTSLLNLQRQVDKQQTQLIQQQIQLKDQEMKQERFQEMMLRIIDPVMIAFKIGVDINSDEFDDELCYVGPCWGPDFDEKVSLALDIKVYENQRKKLEKISDEIWS